MEGDRCKDSGLIYQTEVTALGKEQESYVGLCNTTFKLRYANHKQSFTKIGKRNAPTLSKYVWDLNDRDVPYSIKWRTVARASSYSQSSGTCKLCLLEKYVIMFRPSISSLNSRKEFFSSCQHRASLLLV